MNEVSTILSPSRRVSPGKALSFLSGDEDEISSLQALINILRKPHEVTCSQCWGRGSMLSAASCERCQGTGKRLSLQTDY